MKSMRFLNDFARRHTGLAGRGPSILFLLLVIFWTSCNRDPKKFLAKGNASYEHEKYPEALIYYGRAIQLDPRNPEAHFKLAQTRLKLKSWSGAFAEFKRTVELQPDNWQAQLDLGRLQLAGGQKQEAKDRAQLILKSNPSTADAQLLLSAAPPALPTSPKPLKQATNPFQIPPAPPPTSPH